MMRLRRASTIVGLLLLASAATAHAECAWVLWKENDTGSTMGEVWTLWDALEARQECEARGGRAAQRLAAQPAREGLTKELDGLVIKTRDSSGRQVRFERFWCLPSGTDPRPRYKE